MLLDISQIITEPGQTALIDAVFDFSDMEFFGTYPVSEPVVARGIVRNKAGAIVSEGEISTVLHTSCDRCTEPVTADYKAPLNAVFARELSDEENEDQIFLLVQNSIDLDEAVTTLFILNMDVKFLCAEDCLGLCPVCGANLNHGACGCEGEIDPRLAALKQFFKDDKEN